MKVKCPKPLVPGDRVAIVAPSSPPQDPKAVDLAAEAVEELGFKVELGRSVRKRKGYLAGSDRERAQDLMRAFSDRSIDGIFCLRGGYGASRILPLLNFSSIRRNAKALIGYSDITALHMALYSCAGITSFHGPVATSLIKKGKGSDFSRAALFRCLSVGQKGSSPLFELHGTNFCVRSGRTSGILLGGNLSIIASLVGTKYLPSFRGSILFLEDVGEPPYRIDRYLTQLIISGTLNGVKGIVLGQFTECEDRKQREKKSRGLSAIEVLKERLLPLRVPILIKAPVGHESKNVTLPSGRRATLSVSPSCCSLTLN